MNILDTILDKNNLDIEELKKLIKKHENEVGEIDNSNVEQFIILTENGEPTLVLPFPEKISLRQLDLRKRFNNELGYYAFSTNCIPKDSYTGHSIESFIKTLFVSLHESRRRIFFMEL